ncbi:MAG TPA: hypothetical protein DCX07_10865 [Phycisphaerales bacterium]|nr:hypothetical protein [Phycisphaerales bacterium]
MIVQKIRMGFIGAGANSRGHGKRLLARGDVEIVALAEPSAESVRRFHEAVFPEGPALKVYDDFRKLLDAEKLDAVLISSPHTLHFEQIMACLDAGLHVLAEKPLVSSAAQTQQVAAKARAVGRHVVVAYQRRFQAPYRFMKKFVRDPAFGRLHMLSVLQTQAWWLGKATNWRHDPRLSGGGQLNDSASHVVDVINWLVPEPVTEVSAMIENRGAAVDIDSVVCFRTAGGTLGSLTVLGSAQHRGMCEDWTLSGNAGRSLFLRTDGAPTIVRATTQFQQELQEVADFGDCAASDPDNHFIDVILGKAENESPPENFLPTIRFTQACWKSAAEGGKPVRLEV